MPVQARLALVRELRPIHDYLDATAIDTQIQRLIAMPPDQIIAFAMQ
jgi:hypothetical protein